MDNREVTFHKSRLAFMIIDDEIMYLENSGMSHIEWYRSLGLDENRFNDIVRGYYKNGRLIFYKGDFMYDDETIECAKKYARIIKEKVNDNNLEVWVGVEKGEIGTEWNPIIKIELEKR